MFRKDLSIKLVFSTFKIKPFFSFKDLIPAALKLVKPLTISQPKLKSTP